MLIRSAPVTPRLILGLLGGCHHPDLPTKSLEPWGAARLPPPPPHPLTRFCFLGVGGMGEALKYMYVYS